MSIFSRIPKPYVPKSKFNLSHSWLGTCNMGKLIPFYFEDIVPSDYINLSTEMKIKFDPLSAPAMTNIDAFVAYFFVPYRLVWDNAEDFYGIYQTSPQPDGTQKLAPVMPKTFIPADVGVAPSSLFDYFGFPANDPYNNKISGEFSSLPFRAYNLIWNEVFRDPNLQEEIPIFKGDWTEDHLTALASEKDGYNFLNRIQNRAWRKDYFTSALPFPQRGPEVTLPVSGTAAIRHKEDLPADQHDITFDTFSSSPSRIYEVHGRDVDNRLAALGESGDGYGNLVSENHNNEFAVDNTDRLALDTTRLESVLDNAVSPNVNEYRRAFALQRWLEALARSGARYTEQLRGIFGVIPDDARMQRPEFLGASRIPVMVSEVVQTSATVEGESAQGNLAGYAGAVSMNGHFKRRFKEHGCVIGLFCIAPQPMYTSAMQRFWFKDDVLDFGWPQFSNLGEQEIWQGEIWPYGTGDKKHLFGYAPRYSEYKYHPSSVHGDFVTSMNYWHLARQFRSMPNLNSDFIQQKSEELNRIFADTTGESDNLQVQIFNRVRGIRPFTKYGIPV